MHLEPALTDLTDLVLGHPPDEAQLQNWILVLQAKRLPYRTLHTTLGQRLLVPNDQANAILSELKTFQEEPNLRPPPPIEAMATASIQPSLAVLAGLIFWHLAIFRFFPPIFFAKGAAHAEAIATGAIYQTLTALTLHADPLHLLGNLVFGGFYAFLLTRQLGNGLGWALILLAGALGNFFNALFYHVLEPESAHISIGASTAVFGAMGLLLGLRMRQRTEDWVRDVGIPLGLGVILFAMFGIGDKPNTDIGAHLWGGIIGMVLGYKMAELLEKHRLSLGNQTLWGGIAFISLASAWAWVYFT